MTFTYDVTTDIGKVRLYINDNVEATAHFSDEEIQVFLTAGGSVNMASALALESWASSYLNSYESEKIGDYSYKITTYKNMLDAARQFRETESLTPVSDYAEFDFGEY